MRADAGASIGAGHVMRCLALAQAWKRSHGHVTFVCQSLPNALFRRLVSEGCDVHRIRPDDNVDDARQTMHLAERADAGWVVVDGYQFDTAYQFAFRSKGFPLLVVDDYGHAGRYVCNLVLNQNLSANESLYADRDPATRLLLGHEYILLRDEFRRCDRAEQHSGVARNLLVTLGGTDSHDVMSKVGTALALVERPLKVTVVVPGKYFADNEFARAVSGCGHEVRTVHAPASMADLMAQSQMAVSAGGVTCLELSYLGVPTIVVSTAHNQTEAAKELARQGAVELLGWHAHVPPEMLARTIDDLSLAPSRRFALSRRGKQLVDGLGTTRVIKAMKSVSPVTTHENECNQVEVTR